MRQCGVERGKRAGCRSLQSKKSLGVYICNGRTKEKEEKGQREKDEKEDDERGKSVHVRLLCVLGVVVCALCV